MVIVCELTGAVCALLLLQFLARSRFLPSAAPVWKQAACFAGAFGLLCLPLHGAVLSALAAVAAAAMAWLLWEAEPRRALLFGLLFGCISCAAWAAARIAAGLYPDCGGAALAQVRMAALFALAVAAAFSGSQWRGAFPAITQLVTQWVVSCLVSALCISQSGRLGSGMLEFLACLWQLLCCASALSRVAQVEKRLAALRERRSSARQYVLQQEYYGQLREKQEHTQALWHDLNKYLLAAKAEAGVSRSLQQLQEALEESMEIVNVGNDVVNVILNEYARMAKAQQIELRLRIQVPPQLRISPADLSILVGNTLDNAIEACRVLPLDQRFIDVTMRTQHDIFFYQVMNPYHYQLRQADPMRGYGLDNVRRCVRRYGGMVDVRQKDGFYILSAHLNQPKEQP